MTHPGQDEAKQKVPVGFTNILGGPIRASLNCERATWITFIHAGVLRPVSIIECCHLQITHYTKPGEDRSNYLPVKMSGNCPSMPYIRAKMHQPHIVETVTTHTAGWYTTLLTVTKETERSGSKQKFAQKQYINGKTLYAPFQPQFGWKCAAHKMRTGQIDYGKQVTTQLLYASNCVSQKQGTFPFQRERRV